MTCRRAGVVDLVDSRRIIVRVGAEGREDFGADIYTLIKFKRSNKNTCMSQRPLVREGQRVLGGQVLAEVSTTDKVDVISLAVQLRLTVSDLAKLSYSAQPWQSFYPARSAIVDACEQIRDRLDARPDRQPDSRSSEPVG